MQQKIKCPECKKIVGSEAHPHFFCPVEAGRGYRYKVEFRQAYGTGGIAAVITPLRIGTDPAVLASNEL